MEIMNNGMIRRRAARLSLGLSVVFLALLATLHVLEPEFNSGHVISEYQLGDYGFLMSLAFCILGVSALLLAVSLGPRLRTRGARVGWWWLLVIGAAFFLSGVSFPRSRRPYRRLPARHIRTCRHFRLADCVHLDRWKSPQQRTRVSLVPATMGDAPSVGRFRVVSRFSHCHQTHGANGHAVACVGEPRHQIYDRDLLHLVYGSCMGGGAEATVHHAKQLTNEVDPSAALL